MAQLLTIFGLALLSGFAPIVNIELCLLSTAVLAPGLSPLAVVAAATCGQMAASGLFYLTGRGARHLPLGRHAARVDAAVARIQKSSPRGVVFTSALVGLPPFAPVSLAAGALRLRARAFVLIGTAGRLLRFSAVAFAPHFLRTVLP